MTEQVLAVIRLLPRGVLSSCVTLATKVPSVALAALRASSGKASMTDEHEQTFRWRNAES